MDNLHTPDKDSKNIAAITHIAAIFFAFLAPLAVYLLKSDDVFVKETAKECLNFAITVLLVYIVLGTLALKRARTTRMRLLCFVAAVLCFGFMLTVARAHHPLGLFAGQLRCPNLPLVA